jgi:hypothetical protein
MVQVGQAQGVGEVQVGAEQVLQTPRPEPRAQVREREREQAQGEQEHERAREGQI